MRTALSVICGAMASGALLPHVLSATDADDMDALSAGQAIYDRCIGCHSPERNRTGPLHCGVLGRVAGSVDGFEYSAAMRNLNLTWTVETLDQFLRSPLAMLPGTTMGFAGIESDSERRQLIAWMATLTTSSPLCAGTTEDQENTRG